MILAFGLHCSDAEMLGRIDVASLNEQTLMEVLCGEIIGIRMFHDDTGSFLDVSMWRGVRFCQTGTTIERINWGVHSTNWYGDEFIVGPFGKIHLDYLPPQLKEIDITELLLEGTVHTWSLPRTLIRLCFGENKLNGTFDTAGLPATIVHVNITYNDFVGCLAMASLPDGVQYLGASGNGFTGSLCLERLPSSLTTLLLDKNKFSGTIHLLHLPDKLEEISMRNNAFEQDTLIIGKISKNLTKLDLVGCKIVRVVDKVGTIVENYSIFL